MDRRQTGILIDRAASMYRTLDRETSTLFRRQTDKQLRNENGKCTYPSYALVGISTADEKAIANNCNPPFATFSRDTFHHTLEGRHHEDLCSSAWRRYKELLL